MRILKEQGFVEIARSGQITLTEEGRRRAEGIYERHLCITQFLMQVLGLDLLQKAEALREKAAAQAAPAEGDGEIDALVAARTAAKKAKNFAEADAIREQLKAMGVEVIDTPQGPVWKRI